MDYGYLDRFVRDSIGTTAAPSPPLLPSSPSSPSRETSSFYTRQLYLPVLVTVYQNLEPLNWDILYLRQGGAPSADSTIEPSVGTIDDQQSLSRNKSEQNQAVEDLIYLTQKAFDRHQDKNDYCLVTMDIRNTWTVPFDVTFEVLDSTDPDVDTTTSGAPIKTTLCIQPGWTRR